MSTSKPVKVLFVDDDPDSRLSFRWIFQAAGFDVEEAATGSEALRLAAEQPDVVVLDVNLPDIDGFEVCRRIKAHPGTRAIPVLHLSGAHVSPEAKSHGMDEGADGYLTKPVEPVELVAHVKALARIHQAEEQLREVARQWQTTFDAISDGVSLLDRQGRVLRCNQALARLVGRPGEQLLGLPHTDLTAAGETAGEPAGAPAGPFARMLQTRRREVAELELGERRLQAVADPLTAPDGSITGAVYILSDITERRRLEEQLRQSQKMEAVGQLAGGVAHDFNNLLTGILGNVSLVLATVPPDDPNREMLQEIEKLGWRAAELVRQLLGFSRRAPLRLRPTQLGEVIREVVAILRRTIDPRVQVEVRLAESLGAVQADPAEMSQVLMNLCLNARDAMPEGGRLTLETADVELSEEEARGHASRRLGAFVRLRVSDTGHGIAPELMPHIFEPFFTTKGPGKGTGLGLAMVYGILQQHQGWIECESTLGRGTHFDVYLPRWVEPREAPAPALPQAAPPRVEGAETILFADDETAVRELGREWLTRLGYRVLTAADGQEAVEVYEREQGHIDLVVLDVLMPRLSGTDALRRLRQIDAQVRVLFASGFPGDQAADAVAEGALGFLHKPYGGQQLAAAVRDALDR